MSRKLGFAALVLLGFATAPAMAAVTATVDATVLVEAISELVLVGPDSFTLYTYRSAETMTSGNVLSGSLVYTTNSDTTQEINVTVTVVDNNITNDTTDADGLFTVTAGVPACYANTGDSEGTPSGAVTIAGATSAVDLIANIQGVYQCVSALTYNYTVDIVDGPQDVTYTIQYTLDADD